MNYALDGQGDVFGGMGNVLDSLEDVDGGVGEVFGYSLRDMKVSPKILKTLTSHLDMFCFN